MKLYKFAPVFLLASAACISGTVSDGVLLDQSLTFQLPSIPSGLDAGVLPVYSHTFTQSAEKDVSNVISKLNGIGTTTFAVSTSLAMANMPLGFVTHVTVDIHEPGVGDLVVVDTDINTTGDTITLPVVASSGQLRSTLGSGQVTVSVSLTVSTANGVVIPSGSLTLDYSLGIDASVSVSKGL